MNGSEFISKAELIILLEQYYILILNWLNTNLFTLESFIQLVVIFVDFHIPLGTQLVKNGMKMVPKLILWVVF